MNTKYNYLGLNYPYYTSSSILSYSSFDEALKSLDEPPVLNVFGIYSILKKNYILNNETLIKGVYRFPWMASPNATGGWDYFDLPKHGDKVDLDRNIAAGLYQRLKEELFEYVKECHTVGVLLSGGMDSRVLAGVLKSVIAEHGLEIEVQCFTWGLSNSRDVIYAQKIAKSLRWELNHIDLTPEDLLDSIAIAAKMGAEFSPIHLHGMPQVAKQGSLDIVLAASYGDSIGRAEYSGTHLTSLRSITKSNLNDFSLLRLGIVHQLNTEFSTQAHQYKNNFKREAAYQYYELERQLHYMRRQLMAPFDVIAKSCPVCQLFTHPKTFSYMWSFSPSVRNNNVYLRLLELLPGNLLQIPWARTGNLYGEDSKVQDNLKKNHNIYGRWLRNELGDEIEAIITGSPLSGYPIFNRLSLRDKIKIFKHSPATDTCDQLDERIAWLASLALFVKNNNVKCDIIDNGSDLFADEVARHLSNVKAVGYKLARKYLK